MREDLQRELEELIAYQEQQHDLAKALTQELQPFFARRRQLRSAIVHTHDWISGEEAKEFDWRIDPEQDYVRAYCRESAPLRADLFAELDRLTEIHGPTCEARRVAMAEVDATSRAADRIRELIARPTKRQRLQAQVDLFASQKASP